MCEKCIALAAGKQTDSFNCDDCGNDTSPSTGIAEYYMVADGVWQEGVAKGKPVDTLCIGCLEKRLGRELVAADFSGYPLNYMGAQSPRLQIRRGAATAEDFVAGFKADNNHYWRLQGGPKEALL